MTVTEFSVHNTQIDLLNAHYLKFRNQTTNPMIKKFFLPVWIAAIGLSMHAADMPTYCAGSAPNNSEGNHYGMSSGTVKVNGVTAFEYSTTSSINDLTGSCVATVKPGDIITISTSGGHHMQWSMGVAYIDWNADGEWSADETYTLFDNPKNGPSSGTYTAADYQITVPDNVTPGSFAMRINVGEAPAYNSLGGDACTARRRGKLATFRIDCEVPTDVERTVSVISSDSSKGSVAIEGTTETSVTKTGVVTVIATPNQGYSFANWTNQSSGAAVSTNATYNYYGADAITLVANFGDLTYPAMTRTFNTNSSQQNRYLQRVTTSGTNTPEVFSCSTQNDLPFTNFTASGGTYVQDGAVIDKTATPIQVEHGTTSFTLTYYGWSNSIGTATKQIDWTQEAHYIDWNRNGSFTDSGEQSALGNTTVPNTAIYDGQTVTINIPEGQEPGTYRMRSVFFEPDASTPSWNTTLFTTLAGKIRNGVAYDFDIEILPMTDMVLENTSVNYASGLTNPGTKDLRIAAVNIRTSGTINPFEATSFNFAYTGTGTADIKNLRLVYSTNGEITDNVLASQAQCTASRNYTFNQTLAHGNNYFILIADVADDAPIADIIKVNINDVTVNGNTITIQPEQTNQGIEIGNVIDYTLGNAIWFDTPTSSTTGAAIWNTNDFSTSSTNPDEIWEQKSFPIGNGSFGGNILGSINRERIVLNEKTLWKGGPGTGAAAYWDMNNTVSDATLSQIRNYLVNGNTSTANSLVASNYRGKINYDRNKFGTYTTMGEAYVSTGINESNITDYKRILNMDRSMVVVEFNADGTSYRRQYFCSYPDSVMVWRFTSDGAAQDLTFSFNCPQIINSVSSPESGSLLYQGKLDNNNMQWAMRVLVRSLDGGTVTADASARTITVSGSHDVEFLLAGDTDYVMNFDPDTSDPSAFVGTDPTANVNAIIDNAAQKTYDELYATHMADYSELFNRVSLEINPSEKFANIPTPTRLANYRSGTLDHELERQYFQYGRYLLISSSRPGTMPANLQGLWHNNTDGPWRVDYHNNINLQMNYWPATNTNLLECFTPFIDYVRGLVKPGERTATAYYGARGWTAEVSTNIFGFTAPLNSTDMSWNYNPTAGPWLTTQIWEYYDYTRDKEWLREIGYPIIKSSADFVSDLLYKANGTYTSAPSYSPEHGSCDLGATYANAVTREVLSEAIQAANILGVDQTSVNEWQDKLDNMYPYQIGRYGQLQEWYNDIDTYNDTHRHTNHLFGLHPGTSINVLKDTELADACKETLRQRGDAATGWSMGWKLNHWARLLDGDHAYTLFQNLLKNGTADNMWDMHPPFQIDGNFGGTAGITELFLQSHNGMLHLLPALPSAWTDGAITGLRTRGNFEVDVHYKDGKLDYATIKSNAGEDCKVYYDGKEKEFPTEIGASYVVRYDPVNDALVMDLSAGDVILTDKDSTTVAIRPNPSDGNFTVSIAGGTTGPMQLDIFSLDGKHVNSTKINKTNSTETIDFAINAPNGLYLLNVSGNGTSISDKIIIR